MNSQTHVDVNLVIGAMSNVEDIWVFNCLVSRHDVTIEIDTPLLRQVQDKGDSYELYYLRNV